MRKKSHISLARYMVDNLEDAGLRKHKFSFYLGSILPDIKPSFVYKRHEMTGTFPAIQKHIERLSEGEKMIHKKKGRKYYMDLGQISHYLADYFTFPHNNIYPGTIKDHCSYEEKLKKDLRVFLKRNDAARQLEGLYPNKQSTKDKEFQNAEALCSFIKKAHEDYIEHKHNVEDDIRHIVSINHKALEGMIQLLAEKRAEYHLKHS